MQLTSLRPTADLFCSLLRDALKVELQKGNMKAVKGFVKTCYSELLVANASEVADEKAGEAAAAKAEDGSTAATSSESMYLGGLGLKFKFPGDPKKWVAEPPRKAVADVLAGCEKHRRRSCGRTTCEVSFTSF